MAWSPRFLPVWTILPVCWVSSGSPAVAARASRCPNRDGSNVHGEFGFREWSSHADGCPSTRYPVCAGSQAASKDAQSSLEPADVFQNFYDITQIPRPSGHIDQIREFLVNFGEGLGWRPSSTRPAT